MAERSNVTLTFTATDLDGDPLQFFFTQTTGTPVAVSMPAVSGGCSSAQTNSFGPLLLVLAFGLLRRRRVSA